jgi:hypothetical protein
MSTARAKELAHDYEVWCDHIDDRDPARLEEMLAGALAAERLEAYNEAVNDAARAFVDYIAPRRFMKVAEAMEIATELRALEQAAKGAK